MSESAECIDFASFHRSELPERLAAGNGKLAAAGTKRLRPLAFRLPEGPAFTYLPSGVGIELREGDEQAETVIEPEPGLFANVVNELDAAAGLLYGGRASCTRGKAVRWLDWEPVLRAMFNGRPIFDPETIDLRDRHGAPLDPNRSFRPDDDREDMAHFLGTAGFLVVRGVAGEPELGAMRAEAEELRAEAQPGDQRSWWGRDAAGADVLCRVTRAGAKPTLAGLPIDPRVLDLVSLADQPLEHRGSGEGGVSVIWKHPDMKEGLGDLPWHRDCGMGGHALLCPGLIASLYLTPATEETGELRFLPGSWNRGCGPIDARHPSAPRGVSLRAAPGDLSLHYGDTMHAAPPPTSADLDAYRISAITAFGQPGARPHRGRHYNEVLHRREDGQVEHLSRVGDDA